MTSKQLRTILDSTEARYSTNLRAFIRYRKHKFNDAHKLIVVKSEDGTLYIGIRQRRPLDTFIGCRLCMALGQAGRAQVGAYMGSRHWPTLKNFWPDYIRRGICYLDSKHNFYTHRWTFKKSGTERHCRFCKRREKLVKTRRMVIDEHWKKL